MEATPELQAAIAAARVVQSRFLSASDEQVLADLDAVEELGRIVDGLRVAGAAEVEHRSRPVLGEERLSFRSGARDGAELVQRLEDLGVAAQQTGDQHREQQHGGRQRDHERGHRATRSSGSRARTR